LLEGGVRALPQVPRVYLCSPLDSGWYFGVSSALVYVGVRVLDVRLVGVGVKVEHVEVVAAVSEVAREGLDSTAW
jgi:hypothetical protein